MVSGVPDLSLPEIIETYWNVNHDSTGIKRRDCTEIIETYWNVNVIERAIEDNLTGNNRNILECKYRHLSQSCLPENEIIETYWNVNIERYAIRWHMGFRNNRNILECKFCFAHLLLHSLLRNNRNILECK